MLIYIQDLLYHIMIYLIARLICILHTHIMYFMFVCLFFCLFVYLFRTFVTYPDGIFAQIGRLSIMRAQFIAPSNSCMSPQYCTKGTPDWTPSLCRRSTVGIQTSAAQETGVSRHNGGPLKGPLKPLNTIECSVCDDP